MEAVILVGEEGTKPRPLTCNISKALVPVLNRPFLEHLLRYLKEHGVEEEIFLRDCVIGSYARIGSSCHILDDCVLGDNTTVGKESKLASGTRPSPNSYIDPSTVQST